MGRIRGLPVAHARTLLTGTPEGATAYIDDVANWVDAAARFGRARSQAGGLIDAP